MRVKLAATPKAKKAHRLTLPEELEAKYQAAAKEAGLDMKAALIQALEFAAGDDGPSSNKKERRKPTARA